MRSLELSIAVLLASCGAPEPPALSAAVQGDGEGYDPASWDALLKNNVRTERA